MKWKVGQTVIVQSRTWANINKPGGCAKIIKVHTNRAFDNLGDDESSYIEGLDVKYILGGGREKHLDPAIVAPYEELERGGRSRRGRDFLMRREGDLGEEDSNENGNNITSTKRGRRRGRDSDNMEPKANSNKTKCPSQLAPQHKSKQKSLTVDGPGKENKNRREKRPKRKHPSSCKSGATCSTPEPPRHARKKVPKRVTPIPKVVIVDTGKEADDVSPMWMDGAGPSSSSSSHNTNKDAIHHTQKRNSASTRKQSAVRGLNFDEKIATSNRGVPPLPNALLPPKRSISTLQSKAKSNNEHDQSSKRKKQGLGRDSATAAARHRQSKPKPSQHPHSSFSRATSAYGSVQNSDSKTTKPMSNERSTKKKPLLDVYRSEVEKARKFMDEMVGGPRITSQDFGDNNYKSDKNNCERDEGKATACSVPQKSRYEEFLSHLHKVWIKIDDEEEISEERFKSVFQEISGGYFPESELGTHLSTLCEEGKEVMLSDGMLYRIH